MIPDIYGSEGLKDAAAAVMERVPGSLTFLEVEACQWALESGFEEIAGAMMQSDEATETDGEKLKLHHRLRMLKGIALEFSNEVANWLDARSRQAAIKLRINGL